MVISTPVEILLENLEEENRNPPTINLPVAFPSSSRSAGSLITIEEESDESFDEVDLNEPDSRSVFTRTSAEAEVQTIISIFDDDGPLASWRDEEVPSDTEKNVDLLIALEPRPRYVKCLFDIMYYTGFSRVNGSGEQGSTIQMLMFYLFAVLSLCDGFGNVKIHMLNQIIGGMILHYIRLILLGNNFLGQAVFVKIMRSKELAEFLQTNMKNYRKIPSQEQRTVSKISIAVATIDVVMSFIVGLDIYLVVLRGWSGETIFKWLTVNTSRLLFQWARSNDTEHEDYLWDNYGTEVTFTTSILGIAGGCYRIVGFMQRSLIIDLLLVLSLHLLKIGLTYLLVLKENANQIDEHVINRMWKAYHCVYKECDRINKLFSLVVNLAHVQNVFFLASAMLACVNGTLDQIDFFDFGWRILKIIVTYGACVMISYVVERFKYWLNIETENAEETARDKQALKTEIMRINQRIEVCPIGLGNGTYRITESFVNRFIGVVTSLFMLFARPV